MGHAFRGLFVVWAEPHARIHAIATIAVAACGGYFRISRSEWCLVVIAVSLVWTAEGFNTALERLCDAAVPDPHPMVQAAKDAAAAAVLIAALFSVVIGAIVFAPYLIIGAG
jgi:diacylglycerol kinase